MYDTVVIGGSFAGLETATYLARAMRTVCVIDDGRPRNRFAAHSHGFLSRDGVPAADILSEARSQLSTYPSVEFLNARALAVDPLPDGFDVQTDQNKVVQGKRLVLAFGVTDVLPAIPGIAERWGVTVNHCPYCHGFEFAGQQLGVLYCSAMSLHQARLIPEWGPTTFFLNGASISVAEESELLARGLSIVPEPVEGLVGRGAELTGVRLADGLIVPIDALYIAPAVQLSCDIAVQLGCIIDDGPAGPIVRTDELKATSVPDVFAAGDITRGFHNITLATADGVFAASAIHRSLIELTV